jgi:hypothetical protein
MLHRWLPGELCVIRLSAPQRDTLYMQVLMNPMLVMVLKYQFHHHDSWLLNMFRIRFRVLHLPYKCS